jgi:hypothetical protein
METSQEYTTATDAPDDTPQHFTIRHDTINYRHARFTIFANGAFCGQLTMTIDEWIAFCAVVKAGAATMDHIELSFDAAFELHPPGQDPRITWKQHLPPFELLPQEPAK